MAITEPPLPVPTQVDYRDAASDLERRIVALELKDDVNKLSDESAHRTLLISEVRQRITVRYAAFCIALLTITFMAFVLWHGVHMYFIGPFVVVPPSVAIAMFVGPTVSISTITIMILVGAFRRFKDDDMDNIHLPSIAAEAAKSSLGR